jgi:hypothetical protein
MDWTQLIFGGIISGGMALIWWDVRSIRSDNKVFQDKIEEKIDEQNEKHHKCNASLPLKYADKSSVDKLWTRTDKIEAEIHYAKGLRNGAH